MTTIGFIGSGHMGSTVARLAVAAGYDVVLSNSRGRGPSMAWWKNWGRARGRLPRPRRRQQATWWW